MVKNTIIDEMMSSKNRETKKTLAARLILKIQSYFFYLKFAIEFSPEFDFISHFDSIN